MANNERINKFGGRGPRQDRRALRREEAEKRGAIWRCYSPVGQLASLDNRLGKGIGAKRQRARLTRAAKAA